MSLLLYERLAVNVLRSERAQQNGACSAAVHWHMLPPQCYIWFGQHTQLTLVAPPCVCVLKRERFICFHQVQRVAFECGQISFTARRCTAFQTAQEPKSSTSVIRGCM